MNEEVIKGIDYWVKNNYGFIGKIEWRRAGYLYMAFQDIRMSKKSTDYNKNIEDIKTEFAKYEEEARKNDNR